MRRKSNRFVAQGKMTVLYCTVETVFFRDVIFYGCACALRAMQIIVQPSTKWRSNSIRLEILKLLHLLKLDCDNLIRKSFLRTHQASLRFVHSSLFAGKFFFFYWLRSIVVTVLINLTIYWGHCPCLLNYSLQTGVLCCLQHHTTHGLGISLTASNCASPPNQPQPPQCLELGLTSQKNQTIPQAYARLPKISHLINTSNPFLAKNCGQEFFSCCTYRLSVPRQHNYLWYFRATFYF